MEEKQKSAKKEKLDKSEEIKEKLMINNDYNHERNIIQDELSEISDIELERQISLLQNAISVIKSQRKEIEKETEIILKRLNFLKDKENRLKLHVKKEIAYINKSINIKKERLKDEIILAQKKNLNIISNTKIKETSVKANT